jgi:hypothetical protein
MGNFVVLILMLMFALFWITNAHIDHNTAKILKALKERDGD